MILCIIPTVQEGSCPVLVQSACIVNANSLLLCTKQLMHAACRQSLIEAYFGLILAPENWRAEKTEALMDQDCFSFSHHQFPVFSWFFFFFFMVTPVVISSWL